MIRTGRYGQKQIGEAVLVERIYRERDVDDAASIRGQGGRLGVSADRMAARLACSLITWPDTRIPIIVGTDRVTRSE